MKSESKSWKTQKDDEAVSAVDNSAIAAQPKKPPKGREAAPKFPNDVSSTLPPTMADALGIKGEAAKPGVKERGES
jgi:hypothetical protein